MDFEKLMKNITNDKDFIIEITYDLLEEAKQCYENMISNIKINNFNQFIMFVHRIKGSALYLNCDELVKCARNLEQLGKNTLKINIVNGVNEISGVFRKLQTPAAPHPGQALLGAAEKINNDYGVFIDFSGAHESLLGCGPTGITEGCRNDEGVDYSKIKSENMVKKSITFYKYYMKLMEDSIPDLKKVYVKDLPLTKELDDYIKFKNIFIKDVEISEESINKVNS